ncbi:hypothetical protein HPB52_016038 [Rhipicephalus sanguineus]|uniref:Uncharacterized protein n=1 Tax=Rhipicephalus sanguineus TaxID=34632 RepID=A0A9D4SZ89_RHISA|nr:hypothetical protein HPB52_016038 [Rhipicephalus sanguineus]
MTSDDYMDILQYTLVPYVLDGPFPDGLFGFNKMGRFTVGAVLRGLCGERSLGIPMVLELPMYGTVAAEQRFPFCTFCMLSSLSTMVVGSHMARDCYGCGWLPKAFDVCGRFQDTGRRRA